MIFPNKPLNVCIGAKPKSVRICLNYELLAGRQTGSFICTRLVLNCHAAEAVLSAAKSKGQSQVLLEWMVNPECAMSPIHPGRPEPVGVRLEGALIAGQNGVPCEGRDGYMVAVSVFESAMLKDSLG